MLRSVLGVFLAILVFVLFASRSDVGHLKDHQKDEDTVEDPHLWLNIIGGCDLLCSYVQLISYLRAPIQ